MTLRDLRTEARGDGNPPDHVTSSEQKAAVRNTNWKGFCNVHMTLC